MTVTTVLFGANCKLDARRELGNFPDHARAYLLGLYLLPLI